MPSSPPISPQEQKKMIWQSEENYSCIIEPSEKDVRVGIG